jgi:hypothetical protein
MNIDVKTAAIISFDTYYFPDMLKAKKDVIGDSYAHRDIHEGSLFIEKTQHGDYSGDIVYMSNAQVLKERYPFLEVYAGSYGYQHTYIPGDLEIDLKVYRQLVALFSDLMDLENYIVLDESHLSELEMTMQTDGVHEWLDRGWGELGELQELHGKEVVEQAMWEIISNLNSDDQLFHPEHNYVWFDDNAALEMLKEHFGETDNGD